MWLKYKRYLLLISFGLLGACANTNHGGDFKPSTTGDTTKQALAHTELGAAYLQEKKYEIAQQEFKIAISSDPTYAPAYNGLGLVESALGETAKADAAFKRAVELDPKNSQSQNNYGNFLCNNNRYDESIVHFLEAVKNPLYNTPNVAYTNAGICAMRGGDFANAEKYFGNALRIQPLTHTAAYYLSALQFKRGDAKSAEKSLQNAIIASPNPETLWLGIQIARQVGNKNNEASYSLQLRNQFPDSQQAQMLSNSQN